MTKDIEAVIARIERGTRMNAPDGALTGYVIEVNEWREIRQQLRAATVEPAHVYTASPCWCGADHWDPGQ